MRSAFAFKLSKTAEFYQNQTIKELFNRQKKITFTANDVVNNIWALYLTKLLVVSYTNT